MVANEESIETGDIIICRDVHKWFGTFHVLRGITTTIKRGETVVVAADLCDDRRADRLRDAGVGLWKLPHDENGLSFPEFRGRCARDGITGVLVEGGSETFERLFAARCVDYFFAFRRPFSSETKKRSACSAATLRGRCPMESG